MVANSPLDEDNLEIAKQLLEIAMNMSENKALVDNLITEGVIKEALDLLNKNQDDIDLVTQGKNKLVLNAICCSY